jgi:hypothetical protein
MFTDGQKARIDALFVSVAQGLLASNFQLK